MPAEAAAVGVNAATSNCSSLKTVLIHSNKPVFNLIRLRCVRTANSQKVRGLTQTRRACKIAFFAEDDSLRSPVFHHSKAWVSMRIIC